MTSFTVRTRTTALLTAALLIAAAAIWVAGLGSSKAATTPTPNTDAAANVAAIPVTKVAAINAGPETSASLPATVKSSITALQKGGADISETTVRKTGTGVWIAPGATQTCLLVANSEGVGATCAINANVNAGLLRLDTHSLTDGTDSYVGVAPDGVDTVAATNQSGDVVDRDTVSNNVYRVKGSQAGTLQFSGTGRATTTIGR